MRSTNSSHQQRHKLQMRSWKKLVRLCPQKQLMRLCPKLVRLCPKLVRLCPRRCCMEMHSKLLDMQTMVLTYLNSFSKDDVHHRRQLQSKSEEAAGKSVDAHADTISSTGRA